MSHLTADAVIFFAPIVVALVAGAIAKSPAFMEPYVLSTLLVMVCVPRSESKTLDPRPQTPDPRPQTPNLES